MIKKLLSNFLLAFFLIWFSGVVLHAQNDSITIIPIEQFGVHTFRKDPDLLKIVPLTIDDKDLQRIQPTQYTRDHSLQNIIYDPERDPKRLGFNTGLYIGASITTFAFLWVMPESFTYWNKEDIMEQGFFHKWKKNVRKGPVMDSDDWVLNWVTHPWAGAVYYMSARGSGFKKWESFGYSVFMSTFFWEYGIEAFAEIPSWQDLIITPVVGSVLGEQFFKWKGKIIRNERKVLGSRFLGGTSLFLMDPFNEFLDGVVGYKTNNKVQTYSTFAPVDFDITTGKSIWGMQVLVVF